MGPEVEPGSWQLCGVGKRDSALLAEGAQMAAWGISRHLAGEAMAWCLSKTTPGRDHLTVMAGPQPLGLTLFPACASCSGLFFSPNPAVSLLSKAPHSKAQLGCHLPHEALPKLQQEFVLLVLLCENIFHIEMPVKSFHSLCKCALNACHGLRTTLGPGGTADSIPVLWSLPALWREVGCRCRKVINSSSF